VFRSGVARAKHMLRKKGADAFGGGPAGKPGRSSSKQPCKGLHFRNSSWKSSEAALLQLGLSQPSSTEREKEERRSLQPMESRKMGMSKPGWWWCWSGLPTRGARAPQPFPGEQVCLGMTRCLVDRRLLNNRAGGPAPVGTPDEDGPTLFFARVSIGPLSGQAAHGGTRRQRLGAGPAPLENDCGREGRRGGGSTENIGGVPIFVVGHSMNTKKPRAQMVANFATPRGGGRR